MTDSLAFDDLLPNLASLYQQGVLVPFLGSGMSAGACNSWIGFLKSLAVQAAMTKEADELTRAGTSQNVDTAAIIRIADSVVHAMQALSGDERAAFYRQALRKPADTAERPELPPNTFRLARRLYWPLVITSNYDDLYWSTYHEQHQHIEDGGLRIVGRNINDCHTVLRSLDRVSQPLLWAVQGFLGGQRHDPDEIFGAEGVKRRRELEAQVVIGHQQYQQAINGDPHFRRAFAEVFRRRAFLFLGSGILEDYFVNLFSEIVHTYGNGFYPHVALLDMTKRDRFDERFLQMRLGIRPVFYDPTEGHRALAEALTKLRAAVRPPWTRWGKETEASHWRTPLAHTAQMIFSLECPHVTSTESTPTASHEPLPRTPPIRAQRYLKVTLAYENLPGTIEEGRCVAFSAGRRANVPQIGEVGRDYLQKRRLEDKADRWLPLDNPTDAFVFQYQQQPLFAVAARNSSGEGSYRDLNIIPEAVAAALRAIDDQQFRIVYLSSIASGWSAHRLWHPIHPFAQTLRGIRRFLAGDPIRHVQEIHLSVVDMRIWGNIAAGKVPVLEMLSADQLPYQVEVRRGDDRVENYNLLMKDGAVVNDVLAACGLQGTPWQDRWQVTLMPHPTATKEQGITRDTPVTPTMTVILTPEERPPHSTPPRSVCVFDLILHPTYYRQGFFNVGVEYDGHLRDTVGPIELDLMGSRTITAQINRTANTNGTARILGGTTLRDWFQDNFREGARVAVEIVHPEKLILRSQT